MVLRALAREETQAAVSWRGVFSVRPALGDAVNIDEFVALRGTSWGMKRNLTSKHNKISTCSAPRSDRTGKYSKNWYLGCSHAKPSPEQSTPKLVQSHESKTYTYILFGVVHKQAVSN